jgi:hypothetical protein
MKGRLATTIAAVPAKKPRQPPPAGSHWERIERAREELGWSGRDLGREALGVPMGYNTIASRNWQSKAGTLDRLIARLTQKGYSEAWLRVGTLPEKADGSSLPEERSVLAKLGLLSRRLARPHLEIIALWDDLGGAGPLEKFPEDVQRAAFAAAYLEGRSLEDVRLAVRAAQKKLARGAGVDTWLLEIRKALEHIKPGSGTHRGLSLLPSKNG